jgi:hypothetical protein
MDGLSLLRQTSWHPRVLFELTGVSSSTGATLEQGLRLSGEPRCHFRSFERDPGVTPISLEDDLDVVTIEGLRHEFLGVAGRHLTHVEIELSSLRSNNPRGFQFCCRSSGAWRGWAVESR